MLFRSDTLVANWPAPAGVHGFVSTRSLGDVKNEAARRRLRALLPAAPVWLKQVHGTCVIDAAAITGDIPAQADAAYSRTPGVVCCVMAADCMPVLLAHDGGEVVGIAHAGWRGLCAGVIEATIAAIDAPAERVVAWLGPAIGPDAYEVGEEVRAAFVDRDARSSLAFRATRPGHWHLDLYAVARQRLAAQGVARAFGGGFCTSLDAARFFSYRRDKASERMAAAVWIV